MKQDLCSHSSNSSTKMAKKFNIEPFENLALELQEILDMPRFGHIDKDDINGEEVRMEYYKEKYELRNSL